MTLRPRPNWGPTPYIGVTGFKTVEEVQQFSDICFKAGLFGDAYNHTVWYGIPHVPMFGFLCSNKRLADPLVGGTQSPSVQDLMTLTRITPIGAIPMIHYHSPEKEKLADDVRKLFDGPYELYRSCQALQINVDWPHADQIKRIRDSFSDMQIVLQLPKRAMEGLNPSDIAGRVKEYQGLVQYVLVDPSGGEGKEFDIDSCRSILETLGHETKGITMGIAGGLDGKNVRDRVIAIAATLTHSGFCIDAQGKLRTPDKQSLDMKLIGDYVGYARIAFEQADHDTFYSDR
jgi:hypothetical protein